MDQINPGKNQIRLSLKNIVMKGTGRQSTSSCHEDSRSKEDQKKKDDQSKSEVRPVIQSDVIQVNPEKSVERTFKLQIGKTRKSNSKTTEDSSQVRTNLQNLSLANVNSNL